MNRRDFIKGTAGIAALSSLGPAYVLGKNTNTYPDLVWVANAEPAQLVQHALDALGGMSQFVAQGDNILIKPNMSWDRVPKQAATTNPDVVSEVVKQCFEAGAKNVVLFDHTLNEARRCYKRSGIQKAAEAFGADVQHVYDRKFKKIKFAEGELIKSWEIYDEVMKADKIINLPVAKHHSISGVSLGMKNLMGFLGGNRGRFHRNFDVKITDLNARFRPQLTILDAYRVLLRNGPSGGNLADVVIRKTIIVGKDPVAVDSMGTTLFNLDPLKIDFLNIAHQRGLGEIDTSKLLVKKINLTG